MNPTPIELTGAEWAIIKAVWDDEPCTAPAIQQKLFRETKWTYSTARTRHAWSTTPTTFDVRYDWRHRGQWQTIAVQASPTPEPIAPNSLNEFITEHYWGYTKRRNGSTGEYGVAHPRWQVYPLRSAHIQADFGSLYGPQFADLTQRTPDHILLAEGSAIAIRSGSHFRA